MVNRCPLPFSNARTLGRGLGDFATRTPHGGQQRGVTHQADGTYGLFSDGHDARMWSASRLGRKVMVFPSCCAAACRAADGERQRRARKRWPQEPPAIVTAAFVWDAPSAPSDRGPSADAHTAPFGLCKHFINFARCRGGPAGAGSARRRSACAASVALLWSDRLWRDAYVRLRFSCDGADPLGQPALPPAPNAHGQLCKDARGRRLIGSSAGRRRARRAAGAGLLGDRAKRGRQPRWASVGVPRLRPQGGHGSG
jgi:hypothetical protein